MGPLCMLTGTYTSSLINQGLTEMYQKSILFDLEVFDVEGGSLNAHSCVLASVSPVLRKHLSTAEASQRIQVMQYLNLENHTYSIYLIIILKTVCKVFH